MMNLSETIVRMRQNQYFCNVIRTSQVIKVMKNVKMYEPTDKMIALIKDDYNLLQALGSFGINLGFGDKTVEETCAMNHVDTHTFLAVVNFIVNGCVNHVDDHQIDVRTLLHYLDASHAYFLGCQMPAIRRLLAETFDAHDAIGHLIMKLYDGYARDIQRHMKYEEKTLFPYVLALLEGRTMNDYNVETFSKHHGATDKTLRELKLMIIKYIPSDAHRNNKLTNTLYNIYNNEQWLKLHAEVEDQIFVPAVRRLESQLKQNSVTQTISSMVFKSGQDNGDALSDRERDVIVALVQGMSNKEIANHLCISTNTVITHRRNIARKLQIHSPAGLTIYAIVNGLVDISAVGL